MLTTVWIVGFVLLIVWLARATWLARQRPSDVVARSQVVIAALVTAVLGLGASYVWGIDSAERGLERIRGRAATEGPSDQTPARARLFLRHLRLLLSAAEAEKPHTALIGYSPDADLRLPRSYGLSESRHGWDLIEVAAQGPQGLAVAALAPPESSTTRVHLWARRGSAMEVPPGLLAAQVTRFGGRRGCRGGQDASPMAALDGPGRVIALFCVADRPVAALVIERDLSPLTESQPTPVRVSPIVWRGGRFRSHHVQISTGSLIQIGAMPDALPGVTLWEVPAPRGRAELFFPPVDILASCEEWLARGSASGGFISSDVVGEALGPPQHADADESVCVLPFAPPFGLEVRRLLPDVAGVAARSLWAAGLISAPALLLLALLCAQLRGSMTRERFARCLSLAWLSVFLAALSVWRLLWSHRIDMLRDYESVGERVVANQVLVVATGAAVAGLAVGVWSRRGPFAKRLLLSAFAWLVGLGLGAVALWADLDSVGSGPRVAAQLTLSLVIGTGVVWWPKVAGAVTQGKISRHWIHAMAAVVALAVVALLASRLAPRAVFLKLGCAWLIVLAFYGTLRLAIVDGALDFQRMLMAFGVGAVAAVASLRLDAGVTLAIAVPGMLMAILIAGHDARFGEQSLRGMSAYKRHHAPVLLAQVIVVGTCAALLAGWAIADLAAAANGESDALVSRSITLGALHLLLIVAALFVPAAIVSFRRAGLKAAVPWIIVSSLLIGLWMARAPTLDRALRSKTQAADRVALVVDPGYALLRSEQKFLSGITAWRETIATDSEADVWSGQGYFGAQLIDPGVLLSVENDYLPVLLLREAGVRGVVLGAILLMALATGLWLLAGVRFRHGSGAQRTRALSALVLGIVCVYQPLASLGLLPLTGIAWPGLGLDSPSDWWILVLLCAWALLFVDGDRVDSELEELDRELRRTRRFRRLRWAVAAAAGVTAVAALLVLGRSAAFAMRRPNPVDASGKAVEPFDGLSRALDYAYQLQCPAGEKNGKTAEQLVPVELLASPVDSGSRRFHEELRSSWDRDRAGAIAALDQFLAGAGAVEPAGCGGHGARSSGRWRFAGDPDAPDRCIMTYEAGWPTVSLVVDRSRDGEHRSTCTVSADTRVLRQLRFPVKRPYENARIRLVSRAMGDAARDSGELISGHLAVRLRKDEGELDLSTARAGLYRASVVEIAPHLSVEVKGGRVWLRRGKLADAPDSERVDSWLFVRDPPQPQVQVLEVNEGSWQMLSSDVTEVELTRMALLVVDGDQARSLWLYRPAGQRDLERGRDVLEPLMADDVTTVLGERRRFYLYGNLVPELGWVNPYQPRMSLGLDGWVHAAISEYEGETQEQLRTTWSDAGQQRGYCHTESGETADERLQRVCAPSAVDGVLECRVSLQPELAIRLGHLTELLSLDPGRFDPRSNKSVSHPHPLRGSYFLMRGDSGEIVAQGEFVPGRASSVYSPATPELERVLVRMREDRDPQTGRKLPAEQRGEASAEKIDWNQPLAVGSVMKPILARALEMADPTVTDNLVLVAGPKAGATCRRGVHAILGHCPPTDSLWNHPGTVDLRTYISKSVNWYQAAIGLLGTASPAGTLGLGDQASVTLQQLMATDLGDHRSDAALATTSGGRTVISERRFVDLRNLKKTAMWQNFERLLGRGLCTRGSKGQCRRLDARKDLCAARALPVAEPTSDLRHLVALGPASFDFYPPLADTSKRLSRVNTREYLQFLRGSGLHPLASLPQLTDAMNRVVFAGGVSADTDALALAASWFPVANAAATPPGDCSDPGYGKGVRAGLCDVVRTGTGAAALGALVHDPQIAVYAAKTGTIDSMADIAEDPEACAMHQVGHTIADYERVSDSQPYWLQCKRRAGAAINDSLLVVSFGVRSEEGLVPLTLGLRFQRSGPGMAAAVAPHYVDVIADYFLP